MKCKTLCLLAVLTLTTSSFGVSLLFPSWLNKKDIEGSWTCARGKANEAIVEIDVKLHRMSIESRRDTKSGPYVTHYIDKGVNDDFWLILPGGEKFWVMKRGEQGPYEYALDSTGNCER